MENINITLFRDRKLTKNYPGALLEFSTGENKVIIEDSVNELCWCISKAIQEVAKGKDRYEIFKEFSN